MLVIVFKYFATYATLSITVIRVRSAQEKFIKRYISLFGNPKTRFRSTKIRV